VKIDSSLPLASTAGVDTSKRTSKPPTKAAESDVQLSFAGRLQALEAQETSPVDATKVAAIKQAISEGRFAINAEAIADKLVSSAQELLNKQKKS